MQIDLLNESLSLHLLFFFPFLSISIRCSTREPQHIVVDLLFPFKLLLIIFNFDSEWVGVWIVDRCLVCLLLIYCVNTKQTLSSLSIASPLLYLLDSLDFPDELNNKRLHSMISTCVRSFRVHLLCVCVWSA